MVTCSQITSEISSINASQIKSEIQWFGFFRSMWYQKVICWWCLHFGVIEIQSISQSLTLLIRWDLIIAISYTYVYKYRVQYITYGILPIMELNIFFFHAISTKEKMMSIFMWCKKTWFFFNRIGGILQTLRKTCTWRASSHLEADVTNVREGTAIFYVLYHHQF